MATGQTSFLCPLSQNCNYSATTKSNLKRHIIGTHGLNESQAADALNQKLNIHCHLCPRTVSSKKRLIHHLNAEHFCGINIEECFFDSEEGKVDTLFHFPITKVFI